MIIQLMGGQLQMAAAPLYRQTPYDTLVDETQLAPAVTPAAATQILARDPLYSYLVVLRNSSPGAQSIRIGAAPSYVAAAGMILLPGDNIVLEHISIDLYAVGSAIGALLDRVIWRTS